MPGERLTALSVLAAWIALAEEIERDREMTMLAPLHDEIEQYLSDPMYYERLYFDEVGDDG